MVLLYSQGQTVEQIAATFGINPTTVSRRLRAAGVEMRRVGARRQVPDEEILRLRGQGLLWREIAEQVGMTPSGVHSRWRKLRHAGHIDPIPARPDETVQLYRAGMPIREIAKQTHLSTPTVTTKLKAAGVPIRSRGVKHPADDLEILQLRGAGLTWKRIAAAVGMTSQVLRRDGPCSGGPATTTRCRQV